MAGAPKSCAGGDVCQAAGTCDPVDGQCKGGANLPDGTACDDDNACTGPDVCGGGCAVARQRQLRGGQPVPRGRDVQPITGTCVAGAARTGMGCDDGDACTTGDLCGANGECPGRR